MTDRSTDSAAAEEPSRTGPQLTSAERTAAFRTGRAPGERAAALRAGTVPVPRRFVVWIIVAFVVLGVGGIVVEKLIGSNGVSTIESTSVPTLAGTGGTGPATPTEPGAPAVPSPATATLGLSHLSGRTAPSLALVDTAGATWSLAQARGKVAVVTFVDAACDDICPVEASEIDRADQLLGPRRTEVQFVVVNADPTETSLSPPPPVLSQTPFGTLPNVTYLTGSLTQLSAVWRRYGVTVAVDRTTRVVSHTDLMDFVSPTGRLELSATPFANEDSLGIYSLQPSIVDTFAQGLAEAATGLLPRSS